MIISKQDIIDYYKYRNPKIKLFEFDIEVFKDSIKNIYSNDNEIIIEYISYKADTIPLKKFLIFLRKYKLQKIL